MVTRCPPCFSDNEPRSPLPWLSPPVRPLSPRWAMVSMLMEGPGGGGGSLVGMRSLPTD